MIYLGETKQPIIVPFSSEKQRRYLWAKEPEVAKKWAHKYGTPKDLLKRKHKKAVDGLKKAYK